MAGFYSAVDMKLWLIIGLLRKKLWYYPVAIVVFGLFIAYQLYRYAFSHSVWLLLITVLDVVVIGLTWHEYRFLHGRPGKMDAKVVRTNTGFWATGIPE
ncbi:MAG: DUF2127 domain-containing protein [Methylovirgula sp.]